MKHKAGRPPLDRDDPTVRVTLSLPGKRYDEIYQASRRARMTVSEFLRLRLATQKLPDPRSPR